MIHIHDLCYQVQDVQILKHISIEIQSGEKIALIGPSGAGKSSFLNILSKKIGTHTGEIQINNKPLKTYTNNKVLSKEIGMITQTFDMIDSLSVKSNILMGNLKNWSFIKSLLEIFFKEQNLTDLLNNIGLMGKEKQKVASLSGGEKQRVAIARLIIQNPNIILADEPIASLDPTLSESIIELLLNSVHQKTLIISLHQQDYALKYFDRIIGLKNGHIFFDCKKDDVTPDLLKSLYERV